MMAPFLCRSALALAFRPRKYASSSSTVASALIRSAFTHSGAKSSPPGGTARSSAMLTAGEWAKAVMGHSSTPGKASSGSSLSRMEEPAGPVVLVAGASSTTVERSATLAGERDGRARRRRDAAAADGR